jgi:glycosyltransferase involved in cell wall biosynthesis
MQTTELDAQTPAMRERPRPKRITFVIAHLGAGGAQRVAATAANALVARGVEVHLVKVFNDPSDAYAVDPRVHRYSLGAPLRAPRRAKRGILSEMFDACADAIRDSDLYRRALEFEIVRRPMSVVAFIVELQRRTRGLRTSLRRIAPDAVLSFLTQTNILTLIAARGLPMRVVISERNDPAKQQHNLRVLLLRNLLYRRSDVVTANSAGAVESLASFVPREKLALLPNPLSMSDCGAAVCFKQSTFITVTRLVAQKGLDVLLKAAAIALAELPGWRLAIVGGGPLREELQSLAQDLGIAPRIDWLGYLDDPIPYLRASKFFVLTSRFEGSPNALLEAMACGLASVVADASPGPLELIGDDAGLVVPVEDAAATAAAIVRLANDEGLRARLGEAAVKRTEMYQVDAAMRVWLELLDVA